MLNDKQSLILCGVLAGSIFVFGVLDVLDNFITQTFLALIFLVIVVNFFYVREKAKNTPNETKEDSMDSE